MREPLVLIEQAIYASAQTDRADGYQLVSSSPGLSQADARELALWGPSHDSLAEFSAEPVSINFHRLASGNYCVSRTTTSGAEFSGRGGDSVYTQFLVVPPELLARFSNNPFAIVRSTLASGAMCVHEQIPAVLEPIRLGGRSSAVDRSLVAQLVRDPGPGALVVLLQAALASDRLAVAASLPAEALFAGLICLLPIECRGEFSFSTGLKYSTTRPVRLSALSSDQQSWRAVARQGTTLLDLDAVEASQDSQWEGWAGCVGQYLAAGKLSALSNQLDERRPWLDLANLDQLSEQVRAQFEHSFGPSSSSEMSAAGQGPLAPEPAPAADVRVQRADASHARREKVAAVVESYVPTSTVEQLGDLLAEQPPEIVELLERIDDLVFAAISGDSRSLSELEVVWPLAAAELSAELVEQSREQYLRCALSIWEESAEGDITRSERAIAAIDVLCVLFEE